MKTILIEIKNKKVLQILKDLEEINLIKLIKPESKKKLISKSLRGSLTIKKAENLNKQLNTSRKEWNRNI